MQKPTAVGNSGYSGAPALAQAAAIRSGSSGTGLFSHNAGNEQISALFDHGVIVAMRGSLAAHAAMRCSQPVVVTVSLLSSTTSASPHSANVRFTLPMKPRLRSRTTICASSCVHCFQPAIRRAMPGSVDASSAITTRAPAANVRSMLARQAANCSTALNTGTITTGNVCACTAEIVTATPAHPARAALAPPCASTAPSHPASGARGGSCPSRDSRRE